MSSNIERDETISNNERDETRILNDLPPSYQGLLRRQLSVNGSNLFSTNNSTIAQNNNYENCYLCRSCHNQARQMIIILNRLCSKIHNFDINVNCVLNFHLIVMLLSVTIYFSYLWIRAIHVRLDSINIKDIEKIFVNLNISVETKKMIVYNAKKFLNDQF